MAELEEKVRVLEAALARLDGGALVAFSGGADSALLAAEGHRVLGERCLAVTADSPSLPRAELDAARRFCSGRGIPHRVVPTDEMADRRYTANGEDRCYFCKGALFEAMRGIASAEGRPWILYGAIADDLGDVRPGMRAAAECGALAPLLEAGFTKDDVRERSRALGLPTWDKPAAACLASRFPPGTPITLEGLGRVERAEALLRALGFRQCRVRLLDDAARIEVEAADLGRLAASEVRAEVVPRLRALGFRFVTVDLEGFRPGGLSARPREEPHGIRRNA